MSNLKMQLTVPNTQQPHRPTRNLGNRNHPPPPLGESVLFAEPAPRAPPIAPKPQPPQDALGPPATGPSLQETPRGGSAGPPPLLSFRPRVGSRVMARQARFSTAWHRAVVSDVRITNGRTHVSVIWSDDTTTLAIPLSRVRAAQEPAVPPAPPDSLPEPPFAHLCQGARVMARQTRHSPWCPAMISKRHTYNGRLTITVDWEDTSEGPSTAGIPASRVKLLQADAPRPPTPPAHPTWTHSPREGQHHSNSSTGTPTTVTQAPTHGPQPQSRSRSATKNTSQWAPLTWPSLQRQLGPLAPPREPPCIPTGAPVFTVNECWASLILSGAKTMEIRTRNTLKRGTIYVATSGLGEVWGQVDILDSTQLTRDEWRSHASAHRIGTRTNPSILPPFPSPPPYAWRLSNATRYSSPVPMDRPRGPVTWVAFVPAAMSTPPAEEAPTVSRVTTPSAAPDSDQLASDTADVDPLTNPRRESARRVHTATHSRPGPDHTGDRAALTMEILLRHQDHVRAAMELSNHPPPHGRWCVRTHRATQPE